jgi:hypothetical protein
MDNKGLVYSLDMELRDEEFYLKLHLFLEYLKATCEDDWCVDRVKLKGSKKNCLFGHLWDFCGGDIDEAKGNLWWDWFESAVSSTYMIYLINDCKNDNYQEATPKSRCISFIENIRDGFELTTLESMNACMLSGYKDEGNWHRAYYYMGVFGSVNDYLVLRKASDDMC